MAQLFSYHQASAWPHEMSTHMLTHTVPLFPAASPPNGQLASPLSSSTSSMSGYFKFDANALLLGGLGAARESRARWSFADGEPEKHRSPLERLGFKLSLGGDKKTRDGQQPKRRGPKPDSKPALTRRQELNRQAQRTHRERKELYIKALEQEVLRLKEIYQQSSQEKSQMAEEIRQLKELLQAHGIPFPLNTTSPGISTAFDSTGSPYAAMSTSNSGGNTTRGSISTNARSPTDTGPSPFTSMGSPDSDSNTYPGRPPFQARPVKLQNSIKYDDIGIDFVTHLEKPCSDHMQYLLVRSEDTEDGISGHVLMATCPPHEHVREVAKLDKNGRDGIEIYPSRVLDLFGPDLQKLYDLSSPLAVKENELPPIRAWAFIIMHERFGELTAEDFETLKLDLQPKIRCFGFGAVVEDFEVLDSISKVLDKKTEQLSDPAHQLDQSMIDFNDNVTESAQALDINFDNLEESDANRPIDFFSFNR